MNRQYYTSPFQGGDNPLRVGTIALGAIYRMPLGDYTGPRQPWIIEAFLNGEYHASRRDPRTNKWLSVFISGRSERVLMRNLANGKRMTMATHWLVSNACLFGDNNAYPDLPDLGWFYRRSHDIKGRDERKNKKITNKKKRKYSAQPHIFPGQCGVKRPHPER